MGIFKSNNKNNQVSFVAKDTICNDNQIARKNRILGSLIGGAIGDALGY